MSFVKFFIFKNFNYRKIFVIVFKKFVNFLFFVKKKEVYLVPKKDNFYVIYACKYYFIFYKKKSGFIYSNKYTYKNNFLSNIYNSLGNSIFLVKRFGIVHRLDFDTTGLLIFSRLNIFTHYIKNLFKKRKVTKYYIIILKSSYKIKNNFFSIKYFNLNGKYCCSYFRRLFYYSYINSIFFCFISKILTGRKNQIKNSINKKFGISNTNIVLHSWKLKFFFFGFQNIFYSIFSKEILYFFMLNNYKIRL